MKTKIKILVVLSISLLGLFAFKSIESKKIIVIDADHGGDDSGAILEGFQEKIIVEAIAKKIKSQNNNENLEIVLLREGDHFIELGERVSVINKLNPNLVISLHINGSKDFSKNGVEAYISPDVKFYKQSKESAENVLEKIAAENLFKGKVSEANFFILKKSDCPAMTLEMGYLTNESDRKYITSEKGQNEIAAKILEAIK